MELELQHAIELLRRTPPTLNSMLRDLPEAWLVQNEGPETWSPYDIVGHLIHGEETDWIPRAKIILEHGEARAFDPFDRAAMFEKSKGKSIAELLDTFADAQKRKSSRVERDETHACVAGKAWQASRTRCCYTEAVTCRLGRSRSRARETSRARDGQTISRHSWPMARLSL